MSPIHNGRISEAGQEVLSERSELRNLTQINIILGRLTGAVHLSQQLLKVLKSLPDFSHLASRAISAPLCKLNYYGNRHKSR